MRVGMLAAAAVLAGLVAVRGRRRRREEPARAVFDLIAPPAVTPNARPTWVDVLPVRASVVAAQAAYLELLDSQTPGEAAEVQGALLALRWVQGDGVEPGTRWERC